MTSPTLLLSGFGPFPGVPANPTEWLVRRFAERRPPAGVGRLATVLLPTAFGGAAARLAAAIEAERPAAVVMLGVAGPGAIRLERLARNASRPGRPDAAGRGRGPGAILPEAPPSLPSTLPLGACHRALAAQGLPVAWPDDAGGYVCDDLFFRTRHHLERTAAAIPCGFVHVPPATQAETEGHLSLAVMARAVETILTTVARATVAPPDRRATVE